MAEADFLEILISAKRYNRVIYQENLHSFELSNFNNQISEESSQKDASKQPRRSSEEICVPNNTFGLPVWGSVCLFLKLF